MQPPLLRLPLMHLQCLVVHLCRLCSFWRGGADVIYVHDEYISLHQPPPPFFGRSENVSTIGIEPLPC